ncbi:MAG: metallophosphoesterase family protein [Mangrovibacterium sp.]
MTGGIMDWGVAPFDRFLQNISKESRIDFAAITGDLIDFYEGETQNNGIFGSQIEQFSQLINKSNIPVYATLGNHDITRYSWDNTRISTQSEAERVKATWIRNVPCFQNGTYYSRIYHVGKTCYRLIFLDNGFDLFDGMEDYEVPYIDKAQQNWLKSQLIASDGDVEIIFMHIPLGQGVSDVQENSIYSVINGHSTLKAVFAGHHHQNIVSLFESGNDQFYQVLTAAFAKDSAAWRYIRLTEDNIIISSPGEMENELIIPNK